MQYALYFTNNLNNPPIMSVLMSDTPFPAIARGELLDLRRFNKGFQQVAGVVTGFGNDQTDRPLSVVPVVIEPPHFANASLLDGDGNAWPWWDELK